MTRPHHPRSGFTLIELSIVLVVIGLVVGGVLLGRELVRAAGLRNVAGEMGRLETSVRTFQLKYNALPGDLKNADQLLGAGVPNGNGNGQVDDMFDVAGGTVPGGAVEVYRVMEQLSKAGLIPNGLTEAGAADRSVRFANRVMPGASGDPRVVYYLRQNYDVPGRHNIEATFDGFSLPTGYGLNAGWTGSGHGFAAFPPEDAKAIDSKVDDGLGRSGKVWSNVASPEPGSTAGTNGCHCYCASWGGPVADYTSSQYYGTGTRVCRLSWLLD